MLLNEAMGKGTRKLIASAGLVYGLVLAFYAISWGVDGPTLTMPLAASPLNVPAAILDRMPSETLSFLLPVFIVAPVCVAPFCWAVLAISATVVQDVHRRVLVGSVLISHYIGIAVWFAFVGSDYLLRPFRILRSEGLLLLTFYVAGQVLMWSALLLPRSKEEPSFTR